MKKTIALCLALSLAACVGTGMPQPVVKVPPQAGSTAAGCVLGGAAGAGVGYGLVAAGLLAFPVAILVAVMAGALIGGPFGCGLGFVAGSK